MVPKGLVINMFNEKNRVFTILCENLKKIKKKEERNKILYICPQNQGSKFKYTLLIRVELKKKKKKNLLRHVFKFYVFYRGKIRGILTTFFFFFKFPSTAHDELNYTNWLLQFVNNN